MGNQWKLAITESQTSVKLSSYCRSGPSNMSMLTSYAQTDKSVLEKFSSLDQGSRVLATYIWVDGTGEGIRAKTKALDCKPTKLEDLPKWSIRIPREVAAQGYGYLEDRRPSSNCDPYSVAKLLVQTTCIDKDHWTPKKQD